MKRRLSREKILDTALKMLDEQGLDGISMRKLAVRLEVEAMSIYYYFPDKEQLLGALVDQVLGSIEPPDPSLPWDSRLEIIATRLYRTLIAHPGIVSILVTEQGFPTDGRVLNSMNDIAGALYETGLDSIHQVNAFRGFIALCLGAVFTHTQGLTDNTFTVKTERECGDKQEFYGGQFSNLASLNPFFTRTHRDDDFKFLLNAYLNNLRNWSK